MVCAIAPDTPPMAKSFKPARQSFKPAMLSSASAPEINASLGFGALRVIGPPDSPSTACGKESRAMSVASSICRGCHVWAGITTDKAAEAAERSGRKRSRRRPLVPALSPTARCASSCDGPSGACVPYWAVGMLSVSMSEPARVAQARVASPETDEVEELESGQPNDVTTNVRMKRPPERPVKSALDVMELRALVQQG